MATAWHHAVSSAKKWGGQPEEYLPVHEWFDRSKDYAGDFRHRMLRHHTLGVRECEEKFGPVLKLSTGREIPTRWVGEQHLQEDCGFLPTVQDWCRQLRPQPWMVNAKRLSEELEAADS